MTKKDAIAAYQIKHEHDVLKKRVMSFKRQLVRFCDTLDESLPEYTGWYVLLKKDDGGWKFAGFYNPNDSGDTEEPGWTVCLPIPKPESVEEFQGW